MAFHNLMNATATVEYETSTANTVGGWTQAWTTRYSGMPCRLQPMSGTRRMMYMRERVEATHMLYYPGSYAAVSEKDRITVGGTVYEVQFVANPDHSSHHFEAELRQLRGAV